MPVGSCCRIGQGSVEGQRLRGDVGRAPEHRTDLACDQNARQVPAVLSRGSSIETRGTWIVRACDG